MLTQQISKTAIEERFKKGFNPPKDILNSFLQHGVDRDQVESEITVSL